MTRNRPFASRCHLWILAALLVALSAAPLCARPAEADTRPNTEATAEDAAQNDTEAPGAETQDGIVVELELSGPIADRSQASLFGAATTSIETLRDLFYRAAADDEVKGMILKLDNPMIGLAKSQQVMRFIDHFKKQGKKVFVQFDSASTGIYILASAGDEVAMAPTNSAALVIPGIRMEIAFYKELLQWLGVEAEMLQMGDYKGAGEPYTRESMSPELRREMNALADSLYDGLARTIAERRKGLTPKRVKKLIDRGVFMPAEARRAGLVDTLAYYQDYRTTVADRLNATLDDDYANGRKPELESTNPFTLFAKVFGPPQQGPETDAPKIAIVYAAGMIAPEEAEGLFGSGAAITPAKMIEALDNALEDDTVKGIVLRIDSPGGSALASEIIWQKLREVDKKKPVVACLSDVAASGGYYMAVGCRHIVAEPATITGSIGVVGGKMNLRGLYHKIGIKKDVISRGKMAGLFSDYDAWSPSEKLLMYRLLGGVYSEFLKRVDSGRPDLTLKTVRGLAQGRVYTGTQAVKNGLVDELGGLAEAVAIAKREAAEADDDLEPDQPMEIKVLPRPKNPLQSLFGGLAAAEGSPAGPAHVRLLAPVLEPGAIERMIGLTTLLRTERTLTVLPFYLEIR